MPIQTKVLPIDMSPEFRPETRIRSLETTLESSKEKPVGTSATIIEDLPLFREGRSEHARLSQHDLYPARQAFSREHIAALRLLQLAIGRSQRSINAEDPMEADIEIQKIQMLLPELFCCRALGDGFGTIINALVYVFENANGMTFERSQIAILKRVFQGLRDKPFLSSTEADDTVELLESNGFNPHPSELIEFLSSDQSIR
jgi:hypothetical protein